MTFLYQVSVLFLLNVIALLLYFPYHVNGSCLIPKVYGEPLRGAMRQNQYFEDFIDLYELDDEHIIGTRKSGDLVLLKVRENLLQNNVRGQFELDLRIKCVALSLLFKLKGPIETLTSAFEKCIFLGKNGDLFLFDSKGIEQISGDFKQINIDGDYGVGLKQDGTVHSFGKEAFPLNISGILKMKSRRIDTIDSIYFDHERVGSQGEILNIAFNNYATIIHWRNGTISCSSNEVQICYPFTRNATMVYKQVVYNSCVFGVLDETNVFFSVGPKIQDLIDKCYFIHEVVENVKSIACGSEHEYAYVRPGFFLVMIDGSMKYFGGGRFGPKSQIAKYRNITHLLEQNKPAESIVYQHADFFVVKLSGTVHEYFLFSIFANDIHYRGGSELDFAATKRAAVSGVITLVGDAVGFNIGGFTYNFNSHPIKQVASSYQGVLGLTKHSGKVFNMMNKKRHNDIIGYEAVDVTSGIKVVFPTVGSVVAEKTNGEIITWGNTNFMFQNASKFSKPIKQVFSYRYKEVGILFQDGSVHLSKGRPSNFELVETVTRKVISVPYGVYFQRDDGVVFWLGNRPNILNPLFDGKAIRNFTAPLDSILYAGIINGNVSSNVEFNISLKQPRKLVSSDSCIGCFNVNGEVLVWSYGKIIFSEKVEEEIEDIFLSQSYGRRSSDNLMAVLTKNNKLLLYRDTFQSFIGERQYNSTVKKLTWSGYSLALQLEDKTVHVVEINQFWKTKSLSDVKQVLRLSQNNDFVGLTTKGTVFQISSSGVKWYNETLMQIDSIYSDKYGSFAALSTDGNLYVKYWYYSKPIEEATDIESVVASYRKFIGLQRVDPCPTLSPTLSPTISPVTVQTTAPSTIPPTIKAEETQELLIVAFGVSAFIILLFLLKICLNRSVEKPQNHISTVDFKGQQNDI